MKLISIRINNYKGIEDVTLSLESAPLNNVFTLVGINESGKTTILEVVNSFGYDDEGIVYALIFDDEQRGCIVPEAVYNEIKENNRIK